jgi:hypothetical protein
MSTLICKRFHGLHVLALAGALLTTACGSDGDKPADDGMGSDLDGGSPDGSTEEEENPPLGAGKGEVALRVDQARRATRDGDVGYVNVAFTLANGSDSPPASLNLALFSVKTSSGLYVMASATSPGWVEGEMCNPSVAVGAGASSACALAFELEDDQMPVELFYQTAGKIAGTGSDQRSATAALTLEQCTPCGTDCTYLDRDTQNCGTCGNVLEVGYDENLNQNVTLECRKGKAACPSDEPNLTGCVMRRYDSGVPGGVEVLACIDLNTTERHCGACDRRVEHGECVNGQASCSEGEYTTCGDDAYCVDLTQDLANCGACGHTCNVPPAGEISGSGYTFCGEEKPGECSAYIRFDAALGATLAEGDSCTKACLANGFTGCLASSSSCANLTGAGLTLECPCVW